jgi:RNA polymerase sigma-70 factor (ECF subfamily)
MESLRDRLAQGDPSAFAELYDACVDRVHHALVIRLGSRADADDALQETFLRLTRTRAKLSGVENLVAYVFTVARNEATRLLETRRRQRTGVDFASVDDLFVEPSGADNDEAWRDALWAVAALGRLDPELRELVELKVYGGLTIREIGQVTGLPQGTVATRYRRALETMRRMAKEQE